MSIYVSVKDGSTGKVIDQWVIDPSLKTRQKPGKHADAEAEYAVIESVLAHHYLVTPDMRVCCELDSMYAARFATVIVPGKAELPRPRLKATRKVVNLNTESAE